MELLLKRKYYRDGTNGELYAGPSFISYTIECPDLMNLPGKSCIPEGRYRVQRRSSLRFGQHLHLIGVRNRNLILIHPANHALSELKGCIAPVGSLSGPGCGRNSIAAFNRLRELVYGAINQGQQVWINIQKAR